MENTDQIDEDLLNEALNGYDDDEKLNLTTDAKGEDGIVHLLSTSLTLSRGNRSRAGKGIPTDSQES